MSALSHFDPSEARDAHGRWIKGFGELEALVTSLEKSGDIDAGQRSLIVKAMQRHTEKGRGIPHMDPHNHAASLAYLAKTLRHDSLMYRQKKEIPLSKQLSRTARAVETAHAAHTGTPRKVMEGVDAAHLTGAGGAAHGTPSAPHAPAHEGKLLDIKPKLKARAAARAPKASKPAEPVVKLKANAPKVVQKMQSVKITAENIKVGDVLDMGMARVPTGQTKSKKSKWSYYSHEVQVYKRVKVERRVTAVEIQKNETSGEPQRVALTLSAPLDPQLHEMSGAQEKSNYGSYQHMSTGPGDVTRPLGAVVSVKRLVSTQKASGGKVSLEKLPTLDQYHTALAQELANGATVEQLKAYDPSHRPLSKGQAVGHAQQLLYDMAVGQASGKISGNEVVKTHAEYMAQIGDIGSGDVTTLASKIESYLNGAGYKHPDVSHTNEWVSKAITGLGTGDKALHQLTSFSSMTDAQRSGVTKLINDHGIKPGSPLDQIRKAAESNTPFLLRVPFVGGAGSGLGDYPDMGADSRTARNNVSVPANATEAEKLNVARAMGAMESTMRGYLTDRQTANPKETLFQAAQHFAANPPAGWPSATDYGVVHTISEAEKIRVKNIGATQEVAVKSMVEQLRKSEGTVSRSFNIPKWGDMKLEPQTFETLQAHIDLQSSGGQDFVPSFYAAGMVDDGILYHRESGARLQSPKANQSLRDKLAGVAAVPGGNATIDSLAPDGASYQNVIKAIDALPSVDSSQRHDLKRTAGKHFTQLPIEHSVLQNLVAAYIPGISQTSVDSLTESGTIEGTKQALHYAGTEKGFEHPPATVGYVTATPNIKVASAYAQAAITGINKWRDGQTVREHTTTARVSQGNSLTVKKIMETAGAFTSPDTSGQSGKGTWAELKRGEMLVIQEGGRPPTEAEAVALAKAGIPQMPHWTSDIYGESQQIHQELADAITTNQLNDAIHAYEKTYKHSSTYQYATAKHKKSWDGWAASARVQVGAASQRRLGEGVKSVEFAPWQQPEGPTVIARSDRGRLSLHGYTPSEAHAKLRELGLVGQMEPQIPAEQIFRSGSRSGIVSPLHPDYVRGVAAPPTTENLTTHGLTDRGKSFEAFKSIIDTGGLMGISERNRRGIKTSTSSQVGDIASGVDHVTFQGIDGGGGCGSGSAVRIVMKPDVLLRRDVVVSPTDFGGGKDRYKLYKEYRDKLEAKAGLEVGKTDIWSPLAPAARQLHLDSINQSPGSAEYNVGGQIGVEDMNSVVVKDPALAEQIKSYLKELKAEGRASSIPNVVLSSEFEKAVKA